jgi:poly(3-hydroxybutyrate) depolymerase
MSHVARIEEARHVRRVASLLLMLAASAGPVAQASEAGLAARPLGTEAGAPLGYLEYLPPGYGDGELRPLLVFLHASGAEGDGSEAALTLIEQAGIPQLIAAGEWPEARPFVVLAPQVGPERTEGDCDSGDDLAAFIDFATQRYEVDPTRVYLTGISCGAIGIWDYLASYRDDAVAATVPISGHAEWALEEVGCEPLTHVPVWAFHGGLDDVVPAVHIEGPLDRIRACEGAGPAEMELTLYPDADHDAWSRTYDGSAGHDIYAWMLGHSNGEVDSG